MRRIQEMRIIEIDITNACVHKCSNCTRMCAHYQKPYFMDFDTFRNAIDSLKDFEGRIGIMGGEPLLHPEFDRFMQYAGSVIDARLPWDTHFHAPKLDYFGAMNRRTGLSEVVTKARGLVLLSSVPKQYYHHYELITDTFAQYLLNDHSNPSYHQPALISYKDLDISDEEFVRLRDRCWLQEMWSAGITYKGAFFCEMAGVLDILFNGPGGWKVEPGWWKREMTDYKDQLHWCEICGICLNTNTRNANDEIDDASQSVYKMLEAINSPAVTKKRVQVYKDKKQDSHTETTIGGKYIHDKDRINTAKENLLPRRIDVVMAEDFQKLWEPDGTKQNTHKSDWIVLIVKAEQTALDATLQDLKERFLNPGVLYRIQTDDVTAYMWNAMASSLPDKYPETIEVLWETWPPEKRYTIQNELHADLIDEAFYAEEVDKAYRNDGEFMAALKSRLQSLPKEKPILVPMVAPSAYVKALAGMLKESGYDVKIIASYRHEKEFEGLFPEPDLILHPQYKFALEELREFLPQTCPDMEWNGYLMPITSQADHLIDRDGYDKVVTLLAHWNIRPIGIINAKRRFCQLEEE